MKDPNDKETWHKKGFTLSRLRKDEDSIECYENILEIDPNDEVAWLNKGIALANLWKYEEAIECYEKRLELTLTTRKYCFIKN